MTCKPKQQMTQLFSTLVPEVITFFKQAFILWLAFWVSCSSQQPLHCVCGPHPPSSFSWRLLTWQTSAASSLQPPVGPASPAQFLDYCLQSLPIFGMRGMGGVVGGGLQEVGGGGGGEYIVRCFTPVMFPKNRCLCFHRSSFLIDEPSLQNLIQNPKHVLK